jgi:molybdate transport system ATP-binding protein
MTGTDRGLEAAVVKHLDFYTLTVTFTCAPGETVVLTGPSGSGKTTLLRCLAGLEPIDDGYINFQGDCWNNAQTGRKITPQSRGVGFLSQDYTLFPHMTISENVMFAMHRADDAGALLDSMGIGHLGNKRPSEISGGERQRAALCQTLARRPRLLLLDEPFSALDRENRHALRQKLLEVQAHWGLPIIQVTHDLAEALTLSTRIISLRDGREDCAWLQRQKELFVCDMRRLHQGFTLEAATV